MDNEKVLPVEKLTVCPSHPGEILKELYIDAMGIHVNKFCVINDLNISDVKNLIAGNISCSILFQCQLARSTNTAPELWENLQANYDKWMRCNG